uniref:Lsm14-like N-terminal domain-containing protein n=1 Tax=Romanomermis culicivorax TaxID=13658 RepID=A0A915JZ01_ROMCU
MSDGSQFVGKQVIITCGQDIVYDGTICDVNVTNQTITLSNCLRNGVFSSDMFVIDRDNISDIQIVSTTACCSKSIQNPSTGHHNGPKAIKEEVFINTERPKALTPDNISTRHQNQFDRSEIDRRSVSPLKQNFELLSKCKGYRLRKANAEYLKQPVENLIYEQDFDFEANLALFQKLSIHSVGNIDKKSSSTKSLPSEIKRNYKNDENVLSDPTNIYQNPSVLHSFKDDNGILVKSVKIEVKRNFFEEICANNSKLMECLTAVYTMNICSCLFHYLDSKKITDAGFAVKSAESSFSRQLSSRVSNQLSRRNFLVGDQQGPDNRTIILNFGSYCTNYYSSSNITFFIETDWSSSSVEYFTNNNNHTHLAAEQNLVGLFWNIPVSNWPIVKYFKDIYLVDCNICLQDDKFSSNYKYGRQFWTYLYRV